MRWLSVPLLLAATGCIPHLESAGVDGVWNWDAPQNSWGEFTGPPDGLVGQGYNDGNVVPDFLLVDQYGDEVSLWQFYGNVILLDVSPMWCAPCQAIASGAEETYQDFKDEGFVNVNSLIADAEGDSPTPDDVDLWVNGYGLTMPVVADPDAEQTGGAISQGTYPGLILINRKMKVIERINPPEEDAIREAIRNAL